MPTLVPGKKTELEIPTSTSWLLSACMEARGKQDLWIKQKPEVLKALRDQAVVQSVESSNRIEGVTVDAGRLRPLVLGRASPRDRPEEEIAGYRKALDWIFTRKRPIPVEPATILRMHSLAQGGMIGDAGKWKSRDNEIVEITPEGERIVRFAPTRAKDTPGAIGHLCAAYGEFAEEPLPVLMLIGAFVLDFLCIHPFRDGNGRVSRLMTTLLLEQHGFVVSRYISLERLVEENKESYYESLYKSSQGWHESKHDIVPWLNFFLFTINRAYRDFAEAVEFGQAGSGKSESVRAVIAEIESPFTLAELRARLPSVSPQLIKRVLQEHKKEDKLHLTGRGRGARWQKVE